MDKTKIPNNRERIIKKIKKQKLPTCRRWHNRKR
jgi:hypothetical protein